jgi:hypothetical protein
MSAAYQKIVVSDREQQILEEAIGLIAAEGYGNLMMRGLARANGIKLGALQYHFRTWEDMLPLSLQRHPNKVDGGITCVSKFVFFAQVNGPHPADCSVFSLNGCSSRFTTPATRPHTTLDVNENLVARVTMNALPLARLNLHTLHDHSIVIQQYFHWYVWVKLSHMLAVGRNRLVAFQRHVNNVDRSVTGITRIVFSAEWNCIHPTDFPVRAEFFRVLKFVA